MTRNEMTQADMLEYADRIHDARVASRQQRRLRRDAFWTRVSDELLSIPAGIAGRLGG